MATAGAVVTVAGQLYGLYRVTGPPTPNWFPGADKVEHALGFALPVFCVLLALGLRGRFPSVSSPRPRTVLVVAAVFGAHALVSEVVQHLFYRTRTGDPWDVAADTVGIVAGIGGYRLAARSRSRR